MLNGGLVPFRLGSRLSPQVPSVLDIGCGEFNWQPHIGGIEKVTTRAGRTPPAESPARLPESPHGVQCLSKARSGVQCSAVRPTVTGTCDDTLSGGSIHGPGGS
jgi:hypothetical protein